MIFREIVIFHESKYSRGLNVSNPSGVVVMVPRWMSNMLREGCVEEGYTEL